MTTYTLTIEHAGEPREAKAYSTATNAIDDLEGLFAGGAIIRVITHDGLPIEEAVLRDPEQIGATIEAE